jgi:hypothetical protein
VPGSIERGAGLEAFAKSRNPGEVSFCRRLQFAALALSSAFINIPNLTVGDVDPKSLSEFLGKSWGSFGYGFIGIL